MSEKTTFMEDFGKITEFIETLKTSEVVCLWKTCNTPEFIGLIAAELEQEVGAEPDRLMEAVDTLNENELVLRWKSVNTPEYIGLIAAKLEQEVTAELDLSMEPIVKNG